MKSLKNLAVVILPLVLGAVFASPSWSKSMGDTSTHKVQGQVVNFTPNKVTIKLSNGKKETFNVPPNQMHNLKLHKGEKVTILYKGNTATNIAAR
jgi:type 1 fimbria pilin